MYLKANILSMRNRLHAFVSLSSLLYQNLQRNAGWMQMTKHENHNIIQPTSYFKKERERKRRSVHVSYHSLFQ